MIQKYPYAKDAFSLMRCRRLAAVCARSRLHAAVYYEHMYVSATLDAELFEGHSVALAPSQFARRQLPVGGLAVLSS